MISMQRLTNKFYKPTESELSSLLLRVGPSQNPQLRDSYRLPPAGCQNLKHPFLFRLMFRHHRPKYVLSYSELNEGGVLVHCAAGVSRVTSLLFSPLPLLLLSS